jgi:regulatory protein
MKVERLEPQKNRNKRFNLYADGNFICGLSADTVTEFGITEGIEIPDTRLQEIKRFDDYLYAKKISFDLLAYRKRSVSELERKLRSRKFSDDVISDVISHLKELNLLDDTTFSEDYVREMVRKNMGRKYIFSRLIEKGIAREVADEVIDRVFRSVDEKELAMKIFSKYSSRIKSGNIQEQKRKVYDHLTRKGFGQDVIISVINEKLTSLPRSE